ncbi:ABC transporter permease [Acanthopleuribacter pedis]|uniref:ABC transporter permease n=1 Tax=Acanthopleuribacter pedis TaxID=442870 RepID=A0A8J7Q8Q5_9BACT|nr:ABC transporter permease subunit [Acanthopleuribacter pedis]MBO1319980.1 hypothetical protein [Acanthopleuribacter pedis]
MIATLAVAQKEIRHGLNALFFYLIAVVFAAAPAFSLFWNPAPTNVFISNHTSLVGFFQVLPLFLTVFVPALAMRAYGEEHHAGSFELLLTQAGDWPIVLGKFLGSFIILLVGLAATFGLPLLVAQLGDLDWGPVFGGYLGAVLFGAVCLAVCLSAGVFCPNQTSSFVVSLCLLGTLMVLPVPALNIQTRFQNFAEGLVLFPDLGFFIGLTACFLTINRIAIGLRR